MERKRGLGFVGALWRVNLLSAMEYRVPFIMQIGGMMLNNVIYFAFWMLFFDRFEEVQGWTLRDMMLLFAVVASGLGLAMMLFGNCRAIARIVAAGDLDRYLALPRPVLLHVLASRSSVPSMGDFVFGLIWFVLAGDVTAAHALRFLLAVVLSACTFTASLVLANSLVFWLRRSELLADHFLNAMITFSLYPGTLFDGAARVFLFTVVPAGLTGALPVEMLRDFDAATLGWLCAGTMLLAAAALLAFQVGLRRYESGSAIVARI